MTSDGTPAASPLRQHIENAFRRRLLSSLHFGRLCNWNGRELQVAEGASPAFAENASTGGKVSEYKTVACLQADLQPPPVGGEGVVMDGERWVIADIQRPFAHYLITLRRYKS